MVDSAGQTTAAFDVEALDLAVAGDTDAFRRVTDPYAREIHLHCYRILGSIHDAEDALQETLLRAWRHLGTFEKRSSFRAWLYRIATNVCLTYRRRQPDLSWFHEEFADAIARSTEPAITLAPYPDVWLDQLDSSTADPAAVYDLHEAVQLAFLAAVQLLPPRQRAVLILRDVLGWSAAEVADLLETSVPSVNSALARARATLDQQRRMGRLVTTRRVPTTDVEQALVRGYVEAWEAVDLAGLARL